MKFPRISIFAILVIPPFLFISVIVWISISSYNSIVEEKINKFLIGESVHIHSEISDFVQDHLRHAEHILISGAIHASTYLNSGRINVDEVIPLFKEKLKNLDGVDYLYITLLNGQIVSVGKSGNYAYSMHDDPLALNVVSTKDDVIVDESVRQVDFRDKEWFYKVVSTEKIHWTAPYPGEQENVFAISASYPVVINGSLAGVMGVDVLLDEFNDFLNRSYPEDIAKILISNKSDLVASNFNPHNGMLSDRFATADPELINYDNSEHLMLRSELSGIREQDWIVTTLLPVSQIKTKYDSLYENLEFFIISMSLAFLGFSIFVSYLFRRKALYYIRFMDSLEREKWQGQVPGSPVIEINSVSESINRLLRAFNVALDRFGVDRGDPKYRDDCFNLEDVIIERSRSISEDLIHDPLTGAYNRRFLDSTFSGIDEGLLSNYCLAILDIDYFKRVNDTYGHGTGDEVLCEFVLKIKSFLRKNDFLFRFGGEEFVVLFYSENISDAELALCRLKEELENSPLTEKEIKITFSAGLTELRSGDIEHELNKADSALYMAKAAGRNRTIVSKT